jgi:ABC-type glycerol-3-phosphate transport system substrate-binding protein
METQLDPYVGGVLQQSGKESFAMQKLFAVIGVAWLAIAFAPPAHAATMDEVIKTVRSLAPAQRKAALEEGAKKEGQLAWYTSMSLTDFPRVVAAFEKSAPGVKVNAYRLAQSSIMNKIDTEARASRYAVDIVTASPVEMWELKQKNYSTSYLSPELKAFLAVPTIRKASGRPSVTPIVLAFSASRSRRRPKSYQDLLLPKWKAR